MDLNLPIGNAAVIGNCSHISITLQQVAGHYPMTHLGDNTLCELDDILNESKAYGDRLKAFLKLKTTAREHNNNPFLFGSYDESFDVDVDLVKLHGGQEQHQTQSKSHTHARQFSENKELVKPLPQPELLRYLQNRDNTLGAELSTTCEDQNKDIKMDDTFNKTNGQSTSVNVIRNVNSVLENQSEQSKGNAIQSPAEQSANGLSRNGHRIRIAQNLFHCMPSKLPLERPSLDTQNLAESKEPVLLLSPKNWNIEQRPSRLTSPCTKLAKEPRVRLRRIMANNNAADPLANSSPHLARPAKVDCGIQTSRNLNIPTNPVKAMDCDADLQNSMVPLDLAPNGANILKQHPTHVQSEAEESLLDLHLSRAANIAIHGQNAVPLALNKPSNQPINGEKYAAEFKQMVKNAIVDLRMRHPSLDGQPQISLEQQLPTNNSIQENRTKSKKKSPTMLPKQRRTSKREELPISQELMNYLEATKSVENRVKLAGRPSRKRLLYTKGNSDAEDNLFQSPAKLPRLTNSSIQIAPAPPTSSADNIDIDIEVVPPPPMGILFSQLSSIFQSKELCETGNNEEVRMDVDALPPPAQFDDSDQNSLNMEELRMGTLTPTPLDDAAPLSMEMFDERPSTSKAAREALLLYSRREQSIKENNQNISKKGKEKTQNVVKKPVESASNRKKNQKSRLDRELSILRITLPNETLSPEYNETIDHNTTGVRRSKRGQVPIKNNYSHTLKDPFAFLNVSTPATQKSKRGSNGNHNNSVNKSQPLLSTPRNVRGPQSSSTVRKDKESNQPYMDSALDDITELSEIVEEPEAQLILDEQAVQQTKKTRKNTGKKAVSKAKKKDLEPVPDSHSEPVPESVPEPVPEQVSEPITEPISEPVAASPCSTSIGSTQLSSLISWLRGISNEPPNTHNEDNETNCETDSMIHSPAANLQFTALEGLEYAFYTTAEHCSLGVMRFQSLQERGFKRNKSKTLRFTVLYGQFHVESKRDKNSEVNRCDLFPFDTVDIKSGCIFNIVNRLNEISILIVNRG